jgi:IclR family acetate operon transcriptional repressor
MALPSNTTRQTLRVLYELADSDEPLGSTDIARRTGIKANAALRSLVTLEATGLATRIEYSTKYTRGPMVLHLVMALLGKYRIRTASVPLLRKIVMEVGEPLTL